MFLSKYEKKRPSLHSYFFERNPNLRSDFKNSHFEILAFLYLTPTFDPPGLSQKFWKLYFLKFYQYWLGISNRILHKWISHQQKLRKKMCLITIFAFTLFLHSQKWFESQKVEVFFLFISTFIQARMKHKLCKATNLH